jgi:hypothetical protein
MRNLSQLDNSKFKTPFISLEEAINEQDWTKSPPHIHSMLTSSDLYVINHIFDEKTINEYQRQQNYMLN